METHHTAEEVQESFSQTETFVRPAGSMTYTCHGLALPDSLTMPLSSILGKILNYASDTYYTEDFHNTIEL